MKLAALDARIKLLMLFMLSTAALFSGRLAALAALLLLTLLMLLLGGMEWPRLRRQLRSVLSLIFSLFILQCLFNRAGQPLLAIHGFTLVTDAGLYMSALVALRLLIIVSSALIVLSGDTRDYLLAMTQCRLPYEIAYMCLAALRFLPLLKEEATAVLNAAEMRGLNIRQTPLPRRLRLYGSLLIPIVASALERAEQMSMAMEARAFRAYPCRSSWRRLRFQARDPLYFSVFLALFVIILALA